MDRRIEIDNTSRDDGRVPNAFTGSAAGEFVGRSQELKLLNGPLSAAADHVPSVVLLSGPAGVGKSSLCTALCRTAVETLVLSGACIGLGMGEIPYAPLIDALRTLIREKGEQVVRQLAGPAADELFRLVTYTGGSHEILAAPGSQVRVFNAVLHMLEALGEHQPVLLIFEDLHWADPSTLGLVAYLTRVKSNERMMLLCTYRSTSVAPRSLLSGLLAEPEFTRHIFQMELGGFTDEEFRVFAHNLVGEVDAQRRQRIFDLSEGNPLFAGMLLTAPDSQGLPADVKQLMRTQLDRLSDDAAAITRVAAVAGRKVSDRLLAAVSEVEERLLTKAIQECVEAHILVADEAEETYQFRHALLREAVYQSLIGRERRRVHAALAQALADDDSGDARVAIEMAHHWYLAERKAEALAAAVRAGALAVSMRAFQEAEALYGNAVKLWPSVPDAEEVAGTTLVRVLAAAADAASWAGHMQLAVQWAKNALEELELYGNHAQRGELCERLASYQWDDGSRTTALGTFREAQRLLQDQPPSRVKSRVASKLATVEVAEGRYSSGLDLGLSALGMARAVGAQVEQGRALNSVGLALTFLDRAEEGVPLLRDAVRIAEENDHLEDLLRAYGNLGMALECAGDLEGSVNVLQDGLAQARLFGVFDSPQVGVLANNASATMFLLGRWTEAVAQLDEVLEGRPVAQTLYMRLTWAQIDVAQGRWEHAQSLLEEVRVHPESDPRFLGPLYICTAEGELRRGNPGQARAAIDNGLQAVSHAENSVVPLELCAVGLRLAADGFLLDSPMHTERDAVQDYANVLIGIAREAAAEHSAQPEIALLLRQCEAEHARVGRADTVEDWACIADLWAERHRPFPAAYALWRLSVVEARERRKKRAEKAARQAHAAACELGAKPLREQVEQFARDQRLDLSDPSDARAAPPPPRPHEQYRLTGRELEVLREACAGHTNSEIAKRLHISANTVHVHIHNIIKKLGVNTRPMAVALAHRLRFFE